MIRDISLIQQIQMALIGIVVVAGMFYLWRSICRLEDKVDKLQAKINSQNAVCMKPKVQSGSGISSVAGSVMEQNKQNIAYPVNMNIEDLFMKEVFGDDDNDQEPIIMVSSKPTDISNTGDIKVEDVEETDKTEEKLEEQTSIEDSIVEETKREEFNFEENDDAESNADSINPLSKSKLKKMNLDSLKELCRQRGLSSDGSKSILIDRIIGLTRE